MSDSFPHQFGARVSGIDQLDAALAANFAVAATQDFVTDAVNTAVAGSVDHGATLGLGDDDHPQYILVDASRSFSATPNVSGTDLVLDTDSRLSDARVPTGGAGGDLAGSYPNPSVVDDSHNHTLSTVTDAGTAASHDVPAVGDAAAGEVVKGSDSRLTDARTPTSHTHVQSEITDLSAIETGDAAGGDLSGTYPNPSVTDDSHNHTLSTITDSGTAASKNVPAVGDAAAGEVVLGSDSRLTDARTPTSHTHTESEITDLQAYALDADLTAHLNDTVDAHDASAISVLDTAAQYTATEVESALAEVMDATQTNAANLSTHQSSADHDGRYYTEAEVDGLLSTNATNDRARANHTGTQTLSTISDAGTAASHDVPAAGDAAAGEVVKGSDTRLTDARTPTSHTHTLSEITDAGTAAASAATDFVAVTGDTMTGALNMGSNLINAVTDPVSAQDAATKNYVDNEVAAISGGSTPVGLISDYAGSTAPTNWLMCDGSAVSRTTYSALFAIVGTTYGSGDGSTTFNLPDLRGRTTVGLDNMGGSDAGRLSAANTLGGTGGAESVALTEAELPAHSHDIDVGIANNTTQGGSGQRLVNLTGGSSGSTLDAGSGNAHNNMQPYMLLNKIIYAGA